MIRMEHEKSHAGVAEWSAHMGGQVLSPVYRCKLQVSMAASS